MKNKVLEYIENRKDFHLGMIEEYDEGGYLGIDENNLSKIMEEYARIVVINELKKCIEHPRKPGYKRHDILDRIKELESGGEL
jgi:hypothetical protein